jgi:hypothetical protein
MIKRERWYELNEYALDIAFENTTEEEFADKESFIEEQWQSFNESQVDGRT